MAIAAVAVTGPAALGTSSASAAQSAAVTASAPELSGHSRCNPYKLMHKANEYRLRSDRYEAEARHEM
ncbi:hypothetical protein LIU39_01985 [Streptomyces sp. SF28]|nr:hypothetical protein [Streptomyces pinistramenti]